MTRILNLSVFLFFFIRFRIFVLSKASLRKEMAHFCSLMVYAKGKNTMNKFVG